MSLYMLKAGKMIQRITMLGAGNLATQLGKAFKQSGIEIVQVYSRTKESAAALGKLLNTPFTNRPEKIDRDSDLIIVSVKDDAIAEVLEQTDFSTCLVVHTSGSTPMDLLKRYTGSYGVFYPLQTFSKARDIDFSEIPVCLEASSTETLDQLKELAGRISKVIREVSSEERRILHLSAVFACNFVNHLYYLGGRLLNDQGMSFDLLKPLIRETAVKVMEMDPFDAQTGPARRYDENIIGKHLDLLNNQPETRAIYQIVTNSIYQTHK